jgi:hypothetical protein
MIRPIVFVVAIVVSSLAVGCASDSRDSAKDAKRQKRSQIPDPAPDQPGKRTAQISSSADACADRLHALCGPLLYYYAVKHRLPERMEELSDIAGPDPAVAFFCPVSGKPYVYNPAGLPRGGGKEGLMILYDPEPSHSGLRWAVTAKEPKTTGQPLITDVVVEKELTFRDIAK